METPERVSIRQALANLISDAGYFQEAYNKMDDDSWVQSEEDKAEAYQRIIQGE